MDDLKDIFKRPWIDQSKLSVSEFLQKWTDINVMNELGLGHNSVQNKAKSDLGLNDDQIKALEEQLDASALVSSTDKEWSSYVVGNYYQCPAHVNLKSLNAQINHITECTKNDKYRGLVEKSLRYRNDKFTINVKPST